MRARSAMAPRGQADSRGRSTDNLLFFGCRSVKQDFYYRGEWQELVDEGFLTLSVAASRDQVGFETSDSTRFAADKVSNRFLAGEQGLCAA